MALGRLLVAIKSSALGRRFLNRRITTIRLGVARGFKRRGGLGVLGLFRADTEETRFVRALELEGKTICDLGANLGLFTMFFCKAVGPSGHVYAFDPIAANCAAIEENLSLNGLTNATILQKAVGDKSGEITFMLDPENTATASGNSQISEEIEKRVTARAITVAQVTLDDLLKTGDLRTPDFVKIDVEGMEANVLRGMSHLLRQRAPDLYIEMHGATREQKLITAEQVCSILWDADYQIHHVERGTLINRPAHEFASTGHLYCTFGGCMRRA